MLARSRAPDPPPPMGTVRARTDRQVSPQEALPRPSGRLVPSGGVGVDDARTRGWGGSPRAFKRSPPLRAPGAAAGAPTIGVLDLPCSRGVSAEEFEWSTPLTSPAHKGLVPDSSVITASPEASTVASQSNIQRPDIDCKAQKNRNPATSSPPTGGIALLIEILAREALKDLMAKRSIGCKLRNPR